METLRNAQDELRDRHVLDFDPAAVTVITLSAPNQPEPFTLQQLEPGNAAGGSRWQIVLRGESAQGPQTMPADAAAVQRLLEHLSLLSALRFQSDAPQASDVENWGFNRPELTITLTVPGQRPAFDPQSPVPNVQIVLQLGLPTDRADHSTYARVADKPYVYAVGPEILRETPVAPAAWRERLLPLPARRGQDRGVAADRPGNREPDRRLERRPRGAGRRRGAGDGGAGGPRPAGRAARPAFCPGLLRGESERGRRGAPVEIPPRRHDRAARRRGRRAHRRQHPLDRGPQRRLRAAGRLARIQRGLRPRAAAGRRPVDADVRRAGPRAAADPAASRKAHHLAGAGGKRLARAVGTLALWTLWLGLGLLLVGQIYIACTNTLEVPRFAQRAIEARLALSGVHVTFGRTLFDPSGRILIEKVGVRLPGFEEQVVTARAVYARLDPWALAVGRFEPLELRVTGMSLRVPAMLSPSGHADEIVHDLDGAFLPRGDELGIEYLNFRLGAAGIAARGTLHLQHPAGAQNTPLPLVDFLAHNYAAFSREFADAVELFGALDQPSIAVELAPSAAHGGTARVTLLARGLTLAKPQLQATGLKVTGEFPFLLAGTSRVPAELDFAADQLNLPFGASGRRVAGRLEVRLPPGRFKFDPGVFRKIEFTAASFSAGGLALQSPIVRLAAAGLPRLQAEVLARVFGSPFFIQSAVDLGARTADAKFHGELASGLIDPIGLRLHRDLRKFVDLTSPLAVDGAAEFGAGWKFRRGSARLAAQGLTVRGVRIDEARARVEFDGRRLAAPELFVRLGADAVAGSYEEDMPTRDYRFLVSGRMRPLDISPWFLSWWSDFFGKFSFPAAPPLASADVRSSWGNPRKAAVFVAVDSGPVGYGGVAFDGLRGRLFIRPTLDDGLEFLVRRGAGEARGSFAITRRYEAEGAAALRGVDFDVRSTLDLGPLRNIFGPKVQRPCSRPLSSSRPRPSRPGATWTDRRPRAARTARCTSRSPPPGNFAITNFPSSASRSPSTKMTTGKRCKNS